MHRLRILSQGKLLWCCLTAKKTRETLTQHNTYRIEIESNRILCANFHTIELQILTECCSHLESRCETCVVFFGVFVVCIAHVLCCLQLHNYSAVVVMCASVLFSFSTPGDRTAVHGKPKAIPASEYSHRVQLCASHLQCLAVLRGKSIWCVQFQLNII